MPMDKLTNSSKIKSFVIILEGIFLLALLLYLGKPLLIPLAFAFLISFLLFPICNWLENHGINRALAIGLPLVLMVVLLNGIGYLLIAFLLEHFHEMGDIKPKLLEVLQSIHQFLAENLGLSTELQNKITQNVIYSAGNGLYKASSGTVSSLSKMAFFLIMIPILSFLILLYRNKLMKTLYHFFPHESRSSLHEIISDTIHTYYNFIKGMALVYLIVGILNSIGLAIIGAPNPILFGFLASVLTFIPYVGIMIASLLPIAAVWVTYDSAWYAIAVIAWFAFVQILEAYLIFPYIVGKNLKINTLVIIIMIILGGMLWGAAGMILFIPLISILKLIADRSPKLQFISALLGE
jgi:predicted PurR-regulated permease PerM